MNNLIDVRQTKEYAQFMTKLGWKVICLKDTYIYIKKLPLLPFSVAKILRSKNIPDLKKLKQLVKKHKIIFIKFQPFLLKKEKTRRYTLGARRYRIDKSPLIPTKTIWINLKKTEKQLLKEVKKKIRYSINFAKRKRIKTKIVSGNKITKKQLNEFYKVWSKNKPYNWLFKPNFNELKYLVESFGKNCFFIFAYKLDARHYQLVSGVFILFSKNMSFDWFGANTLKGRKLLAKPLVLWEAIKESKKRGLRIFDFGGIYDKRFSKLNKGWIGFSNFKKGFGGKEVEFCQPLIKLLPGGA